MIPLKINGKNLIEIFDPEYSVTGKTDTQIQQDSIRMKMFPTEVKNTSETYSRDAERTANYELEDLVLVNRKAKPEFTWSLLKAEYVANLLSFLEYNYNFKNAAGVVTPKNADIINVTYMDFTGMRTIEAYLGQTIEGTLVEYEEYDEENETTVKTQYWENFRIAFPER